jgi:hypothetical protein
MLRLRPQHAFVGVASCAAAGIAVLTVAACTGDDPDFIPSTDAASTDGNDSGARDGSDAGAPLLRLEADPFAVTTGSNDTLRLRVVERRNVGDVDFRIDGKPEGVTLPSVAKLGAADTSMDIPVSALPSARHGDYPITLTAEGHPFGAAATIVVRGLPGAVDTGFGTEGASTLVVTPGSDYRVVPLANGRVLLAWTRGGGPVVRVLDPKGQPVLPELTIAQQGTLDGVAAFADSSFVLAIRNGSGVQLAWYTPALTAGPQLLVPSSSSSHVARLASAPAGAILAQTRSVDGGFPTVIQRYLATGTKDPAFADVEVDAVDPMLGMVQATASGAAWITTQRTTGASVLVHAAAGSAPMMKSLPMNESCPFGADIEEDIVTRCSGEDQPRYRVQRYAPDGGRRSDFGVDGNVAVNGSLDTSRAILSNRNDRFYVVRGPSGFTTEILAFDAKGTTRSVFATNGMLTIAGSDGQVVMALDARGRIVAADPTYVGSDPAIRVRRYWD